MRRIVSKSVLNIADHDELDRLCRTKHKADTSPGPVITLEPLATTHLPPSPTAGTSVSLVSVGNLNRVGRIPSDQVISFNNVAGLTIIYGDNGSGKSRYAQVIKKACRTRGNAHPIRPDAFSPAVSGMASATIVYRVATADVRVTWTDGPIVDSSLANIFVFDAFSQKGSPSFRRSHFLHLWLEDVRPIQYP